MLSRRGQSAHVTDLEAAQCHLAHRDGEGMTYNHALPSADLPTYVTLMEGNRNEAIGVVPASALMRHLLQLAVHPIHAEFRRTIVELIPSPAHDIHDMIGLALMREYAVQNRDCISFEACMQILYAQYYQQRWLQLKENAM